MESDKELYKSYIEGNQEAFNLLLQRYLPTIKHYSRVYFAPGVAAEDLVQEGRIGLFKAVKYYRPESNILFSFYAKLYIKAQVFNIIRASTSKKHSLLNRSLSIHYSYLNLEGNKRNLEELIEVSHVSAEEEFFQNLDFSTMSNSIIGKLTFLEQNVFTRRLEGKSNSVVAKELGVSNKTVDNALMRIKRKAVVSVSEKRNRSWVW